ncbi:unnamed protein product [Rhizophagus irregularis]|nr:unnamed protein product [Rhizophagus irregularis]CAB5298433.1 unnamed protein product [Rhizophagus irregularis]
MWILLDAVGMWKTVQSDANLNFLSTPASHKTQCNRRITSKYSKLGVLVYQRETTIYSMHHIKEVYFSKSRVMDYYLKLQDISRKVQKYSPTNEKPLEASPSKGNQQDCKKVAFCITSYTKLFTLINKLLQICRMRSSCALVFRL